MDDLALLVIRLVVGALIAGHGAQKLLGWFGGGGLPGTTAVLASAGLQPARAWALLAAVTELGSGLLTMLGLFFPLAPIGILAAMTVAIATVHWGAPIWAEQGGAELPLTNAAVATALILAGPGGYALDHYLSAGLAQVFALMTGPALVLAALGVALALVTRRGTRPAEAGEAVPAAGAHHSL